MYKSIAVPFLVALAFSMIPATHLMATPVTMARSYVGNPGNTVDYTTGYGAVDYSYNIGTYDVTNSQYVAFLNSNDPTGVDPLKLYDSSMSNATYGGIDFNPSASTGSMYSIISGNGNNPVNFVTWYDALRFANWMDNGQPIYATEPTATSNATENGSYTLDGFEPTPSNGNNIIRNMGATIVLPSENEWYKAAYYNPATSSYFLYPTSSNMIPNESNPTSTPNSANYGYDNPKPPADDNVLGTLTAVGAYSGTTSPYGAYDMGGDVYQWNEAFVQFGRELRGGSFLDLPGPAYDAYDLESSNRYQAYATSVNDNVGFRLAMVPEPSSLALLVFSHLGLAVIYLRRRRQIESR